MSSFTKRNRFFLVALVAVIIFSGLTFTNLPGPDIPTGVRIVNGVTFDFSDYKAVDHELLAIFNYLNTLVSTDYQDYDEWEGWYVDEHFPRILRHISLNPPQDIEQPSTVISHTMPLRK
jgi:hypothetical protein